MKITFFINDVDGIEKAEVPIEFAKTSVLFGPNGSGKTRILSIINRFFGGSILDGVSCLVEFSNDDIKAIPYFYGVEKSSLDSISIDDPEWEPLLKAIMARYEINTNDPEVRSEIEANLQDVGFYHQMHPFYFSDLMESVIHDALIDRIRGIYERTSQEQEALFEWRLNEFVETRLRPIKRIRCIGRTGTEYLEEPVFNCLTYKLEYIENTDGKRTLCSTPCLSEGGIQEMDINIASLRQHDIELYEVLLELAEKREKIFDTSYYCLPMLRSEACIYALPSLIYLRIEEGIDPVIARLVKEAADFSDRFRKHLDRKESLISGLEELIEEIEIEERLSEYKTAASIAFYREVERYANEFLSNWYPSSRKPVLGIADFRPRVLIQWLNELGIPDGPPYEIENASSAEKTWIALAIHAAINSSFLGKFEDLKEKLYSERYVEYLARNAEAKDSTQSDDEQVENIPSEKVSEESIECTPEKIRDYCEGIARDLDFDDLYENRLPMMYRPWKRIFCVDEPELHLHTCSQRLLAEQMQRMCRDLDERISILLATHSPYFLATRNVIPVRTIASENAMNITTKIQGGFDTREARYAMGWKNGEFLIGLPHLVFVEGPNDKLILEIMYGDFLRNWRISIIPLGGTNRLGRLRNSLTDMLIKGVDEFSCSFILDRAQEKVFPSFCSVGDDLSQAEKKVPELKDRIDRAQMRNSDNEEEKAFVQCVEALKCLEDLTGRPYLELVRDKNKGQWERVITSAVRKGDYRGIDINPKDTIIDSISNYLEKDPYISLLRLWAGDWSASLHLLSKKDILSYLDMKIIGRLYGLDEDTVLTLEQELFKIKQALARAIGVKSFSKRYIERTCIEMAKVNPLTDGLTLDRSCSSSLDEITGIIEKIAMKQDYMP